MHVEDIPAYSRCRSRSKQAVRPVHELHSVQAVYNRDNDQVTIHATLTDATPQAIKDLLAGPGPTTAPRWHHSRGPLPKIMLAI